MIDQRFFTVIRFGPISVGHRQCSSNGRCSYTHGYGRIVKITVGAKALNNGMTMSPEHINAIEHWLNEEWNQKVLLSCEDPLLDQYKTLHELGGVDINILPDGYGPGVEQSSMYVYDNVTEMVFDMTHGRCNVEMVQLWEYENNVPTCAQYPT